MGNPITFNGQPFTVPALGESGWGTTVSNYLTAIASGCLQKTGGAFTLAAEVNFGTDFGLKSKYYTSLGTTATTGVIRLARNESVSWRNEANSADIALTLNSSNQLVFNGVIINSGTALTASRAMVTDASGIPSTSVVTTTELSYASGVTSALQTQLNTGASNLTTHVALTTAHGATGAVVGTTNTQTLTNKLISSTAAITGALTLPSGTVAQRPTPAAGMTRLNTDANEFEGYSNGAWQSIGGGVNERPQKNYLKAYANANIAPGTVLPVAVAGTIAISSGTSAFYANTGSSSSDVQVTTTLPLRGTQSYYSSMTSVANIAGSTFFQLPAFTLELADLGKPLNISFDVSATTGTIAANSWDVVVAWYNSTGTFLGLIPIAGTASACTSTPSAVIPTGTTTLNGFFIPTSTADDTYALRFRMLVATSNIKFDTLMVGNEPIRVGAAVTDWVSYTPTTVGLGTVGSIKMFYRRVGDSVQVAGSLDTGTTTAVTAFFGLPPGLSTDVSKQGSVTSIRGSWWNNRANASTVKRGTILSQSSTDTSVIFGFDDYTTASAPTTALLGSQLVTTVTLYIDFSVPIANWSSNVQMADRALEEYASNSGAAASADNVSFVYGSAGSNLQCSGVAATPFTRRVRFSRPVQATDSIEVEVLRASSDSWVKIAQASYREGVSSLTYQNGVAYGVGIDALRTGASTDVDVSFGRYVFANGATYGATGLDWNNASISTYKWRCRLVSSGAQIGGAISTSNIVGRTDGSTVGSGYIGEEIIATSTSLFTQATPVAGTFYSITGLSITLTAGVWDISVSNVNTCDQTSGTGQSLIYTQLYNSTDSTGLREVMTAHGLAAVVSPITTHNLIHRVVITASKTYVVRTAYGNYSATPTVANLYSRGNLVTGGNYIRAVRIA